MHGWIFPNKIKIVGVVFFYLMLTLFYIYYKYDDLNTAVGISLPR